MSQALLIALAYLIGSVPFGVLFTRGRGIDLRGTGSGNIGATNVLRAAGKRTAVLTLAGDLLKGSAAVALAQVMGAETYIAAICGLSAVVGHNFPVFLRFKGGKGVATGLGAILVIAPGAGILSVIIWLVTVIITRYSSLGAIVAFTVLPAAMVLLGAGWPEILVSAAISALLILRHSGNIKRLVEGTERRIGESS